MKKILFLCLLLSATNLRAGEILKSPQLSDSQTRQQKKAIDYELYFPPEEKKKSLPANKKKTQRQKDIKVKNKKPCKKSDFEGYINVFGTDFWIPDFIAILVSLLLSVGGIVVFAIGVNLFNPIIWIIGLALVVIGLMIVLILNYWLLEELALVSIFWYFGFLLAGIVLFIIGLVINVLALWVGGIVFAVAVLLFFLIRYLSLIC